MCTHYNSIWVPDTEYARGYSSIDDGNTAIELLYNSIDYTRCDSIETYMSLENTSKVVIVKVVDIEG